MNMPAHISNDAHALRQSWREVIADKPMRNRDAAEFLGVTELELIASLVGENRGDSATRLAPHWVQILQRVQSLGRVMALTRNDAAVHERRGVYQNISVTGHMGLALGEDIDLRLFFAQWAHGYAVEEIAADGVTKRSLQFFDAAGGAVHKIFLQHESDAGEFEMLVEQFRADMQTPGQTVRPRAPAKAEADDSTINVDAFRASWADLKDTHEFFGLLKQHGVTRSQAMRLADNEFATRVHATSARHMLETAAAAQTNIMCFVGNVGCIQIHTGPVANIKVMGPWLNVLDEAFNLHLREDMIREAWVVKKPTTEGLVTSLELFDSKGDTIAQFFGKRKPGIPELPQWREIIAGIPAQAVALL